MQELQLRLNPYCSGQWSSTDGKISKFLVIGVLILVVVDNGLVRHLVTMFSLMLKKVLILVVVDDGLVPQIGAFKTISLSSLNPCCSGRWSRTSLFLSLNF